MLFLQRRDFNSMSTIGLTSSIVKIRNFKKTHREKPQADVTKIDGKILNSRYGD